MGPLDATSSDAVGSRRWSRAIPAPRRCASGAGSRRRPTPRSGSCWAPSSASSRDWAPSSSTRRCDSRRTSSSRSSPATEFPCPSVEGGRWRPLTSRDPGRYRSSRASAHSPERSSSSQFAPEAEGHGTDAAIAAVHHNPRGVRLRTVFVKIVASALTIGSGGSGGREGPTGQISAGFGSFLARFLDLSPADARIAVASGIGSGIGSIFGAPLGGAVLATEILYRDDFEVEALLPSFIASIVGYSRVGVDRGLRSALRLRRELPPHRAPSNSSGSRSSASSAGSSDCSTPRASTASPPSSAALPLAALAPAGDRRTHRGLHRARRSPRCSAPATAGSRRGSAANCCTSRSGSCSSCPSRASRRPGSRSARADRAASSVRAW